MSFFLGGFAFGAGACTDIDLEPILRERVAVSGLVCAPPPISIDVPYKILFVIDSSFSNRSSDPSDPVTGENRRTRAVRQAIAENVGNPNVSFGIITFATDATRQTFTFTRDRPTLETGINNITDAGQTDYFRALELAFDFITDDLTLTGGRAVRSSYEVFWISDGEPTVGNTNEQSIFSGIDFLTEVLQQQAGDFRLNTVFLDGAADATQKAIAETLLRGMSARADGTFTNVGAGDAIPVSVSAEPIVRRFSFASFFALAENARFRVRTPLVDSDADGLPDEEELLAGSDPLLADSDRDGVRDGIEVYFSDALDPRQANPVCTATVALDLDLDQDGDGLTDCEELVVGTDPRDADSDGDLVTDFAEVLNRGVPLDPRPTADIDLDGIPDTLEVRTGLDPAQPTDERAFQRWSHIYEPAAPTPVESSTTACFRVAVSNLVVRQTLGGEGRRSGPNNYQLVAAFQPTEGGPPVLFQEARFSVEVTLTADDDEDEARVSLTPENWVALPPPRDF